MDEPFFFFLEDFPLNMVEHVVPNDDADSTDVSIIFRSFYACFDV